MPGAEMRELRKTKNLNLSAFAVFLNQSLDRNYGKAQISRWENGTQSIPANVAQFLRSNGMKTQRRTQYTVGRSPIVIAIANQKGGVAKTTTAVNLSYGLAARGFPTLLVDMDAQASASLHLNMNIAAVKKAGRTIADALLRKVALADVLHPVEWDVPLHVAPSCFDISSLEMLMEAGREKLLSERLETIPGKFAFVIIDCPPHLGNATQNALAAADYVLIPTQAAVLSVDGLTQLLGSIEVANRRLNPRLKIWGILPTMVQPRNRQDADTLNDLEQTYAGRIRLFPYVVRSTNYEQAAAAARATLEVLPKTIGIEAYNLLCEEAINLLPAVKEVVNG